MDVKNSILKDVREAVGLSSDSADFDTDLLMHINSSINILNQNGVGKFLVVKNENQTWEDLMDSSQSEGNQYFGMVPLYIAMNTKLIFDPPPPSNVEYYSRNISDMLWRLKTAYEGLYVSGGETNE